MHRTLVLGLALAASVFAQSDPLASISDGDRIELSLTNGTVFRGEVVWCVEGKIKIDISFDSPETDGALVFEQSSIARVVRLDKLTQEQKERILREKDERRKRLLAEIAERERKAAAELGAEMPEGDLASPGDKELLEKFPPGEWSPERRKELAQKDPSALSEEEQEFLARFKEWQKAVERKERNDKVDKFSPANGWDEKRYADLVGRDPATLTDDEREFVAIHDELVKGRADKEEEDRAGLLEEFPPGSEWNEETYDRLKTQFIRISVPPTAREQKFIDNFDEWKLALKESEEKSEEEEELKKELKKELDKEREGSEPEK